MFSIGTFTLGTLLGALITQFINHLLSKDRLQHDRFADAGQRLREAFSPELAILDPKTGEDMSDPAELLKTALSRHKKAIIEFEYYLSPDNRTRLGEAWVNYYGACGDDSSPQFAKFMIGDTAREDFVNVVHAILDFTDDKYRPKTGCVR